MFCNETKGLLGSTGEAIHIVLSPNDGYARHAGVMITSLLAHADASFAYRFHVLSSPTGLSSENREKLARCLTGHNATMMFVPVRKESFAAFPLPSYYSVETYYRLAMPEVLPDVAKCIYLDADLVICADISRLWRIDISQAAVAAVRDRAIEMTTNGDNAITRLGVRQYFNGGVLVVNLAWWREHHVVERCARFLNEKAALVRCADQDALNVVLAGSIRQLHPAWNVPIGWGVCLTRRGCLCFVQLAHKHAPQAARRAVTRKSSILHIGGGPWFAFPPKPHLLPYWRWVRRTPWRSDMSKRLPRIALQLALGFAVSLSVTAYYRICRWLRGDGHRYAAPYDGYSWDVPPD